MPPHEKKRNTTAEVAGDVILLTGASGYVGSLLLKALIAGNYRVRCAVRRPETIQAAAGISVVRADVLDRGSIGAAMRGVDTAFYLIHSMNAGRSFEQNDRKGARNFAHAARKGGVRRIIYLGGLGNRDATLSAHLRSRLEVGDLLRTSGAQVIEFRASAIIGAGSLSFEMVRALAERLPVMITPRWVTIEAQPIAIDDVISYLMAGLAFETTKDAVFEIGGAERVSYGGLLREYARQRGLRRAMIRVPVLTPRLSSWWLRLVTPLQARVGRELIEGVRQATVVTDDLAARSFSIRPVGIRKAISDALRAEDQKFAAIRWSHALSATPPASHLGSVRIGNRLVVSQTIDTTAAPAAAFAPIRRIGGPVGWYYGRWLWAMRAFADQIVGGPGMRGRKSGGELVNVGDRIDFWQVSAFEPDRKLTLAAEMKVPGRAWLDFEVEPNGTGSTIRQTAIFDPAGLSGLLYWYLSMPIHQVVFAGMLRSIAAAGIAGSEPALPAHSVIGTPS